MHLHMIPWIALWNLTLSLDASFVKDFPGWWRYTATGAESYMAVPLTAVVDAVSECHGLGESQQAYLCSGLHVQIEYRCPPKPPLLFTSVRLRSVGGTLGANTLRSLAVNLEFSCAHHHAHPVASAFWIANHHFAAARYRGATPLPRLSSALSARLAALCPSYNIFRCIAFVGATRMMGLGILEDHALDNVPGTAHVLDSEEQRRRIEDASARGGRALKYDKTGKILLVPQPGEGDVRSACTFPPAQSAQA